MGNEKFDSFLDPGSAIFRWECAHQRVLLHRLLQWRGGKTATSNWENWETARGSSPFMNQNIQHHFLIFPGGDRKTMLKRVCKDRPHSLVLVID